MRITKKISSCLILAAVGTAPLWVSFPVDAQTQPAQKTSSAPAPAKPATAPAKSAPAKPATAATTSRPSNAGTTTTHAPTTSSATTGPTTSNPGRTPITTTNSGRTPVTNSNAGRIAGPTAGTRPATIAAGRPGAIPGVNHGPLAHPAARGDIERRSPTGVARMRPDGRPADIHNARLGMDVHHNLAGGRRIESVRPDGLRLVSERGRPGYIGRPYAFHGHDFERRAYYDHGRVYNRYYGAYGYHGYNMHVYAPGRYYPAAYYGWAYRPWGTPVRYGWGFQGSPWYGYYGAYYTPYPVYASPALWLTDYTISQTLSAAYQARVDAGADGGPAQAAYAGPALSPEAKQMIANEVQNDLALENAQAATNQQQGVPDARQSSVARLMEDGKPHAFVAGREVDVVDDSGNECAITDGDIVQLAKSLGSQDTTANVTVVASKGGKDCQRGVQVAVGIDELQEMDNHLREQVDAGLQELAARQGKNGLPAAPAAALAAPSDALVAQGAPPPDPNGAQELAQQDTQAQQAEQEVLASASNHGPSAPPPGSNEDLFKPTPPPPPQ